uniref:Putative efflux transporter, RND family, MFP subunit n=1 Tax=Magnetococcus massalia (strain MO-1) TaxID=451514 RepID=A0A1S7LMC2_MAGMO|nr:Putative efflux transporter, RND family, MFP subunit [Candidatus Magnetococcus massalia]
MPLLAAMLLAHGAWAESTEKQAQAEQAEKRAAVVTVKSLAEMLLQLRAEAPAMVRTLRDVWVTTQISAPLREIHGETGDRVAWGQVLARQDTWAQRMALKRAEASLKVLQSQMPLAEQQLTRVQKLWKKGQSTEELLERRVSERATLKARIEEARVAVEQHKLQVDKGMIRAPFSGVIVERRAHIGGWSDPGTALFRLVDPARVVLSAELTPERIESARLAKRWQFEHTNGSSEVKLESVLPLQSASSRTIEARFRFAGDKPMPGVAGRLVWTDDRGWLEPSLLERRGGQLGLFVIDETQHARFMPLANAQEGRRTRIPAGLKSHPRVVVDGRQNLQDGDRISYAE